MEQLFSGRGQLDGTMKFPQIVLKLLCKVYCFWRELRGMMLAQAILCNTACLLNPPYDCLAGDLLPSRARWFFFHFTARAQSSGRQFLHNHVPRSAMKRCICSRWAAFRPKRLNLAIGLPLRNQQALDDLLRQIYDPPVRIIIIT